MKHMLRVALFCCCILACYCADAQNKFALIELYTSEGCSSCPAAENLMPQLKDKYKDRLFILQFHVDYWNRLGWRDEFSKAEYSDRQRMYSRKFKGNTVYTPQAIVNGVVHSSGSDKRTVNANIMRALSEQHNDRQLKLAAVSGANGIEVQYSADISKGEVVNIALVQKKATTAVKTGENAGKVLEHHNIVSGFSSFDQPSATASLSLPTGLTATDCYVLAYIQQKEQLEVTGITSTEIH